MEAKKDITRKQLVKETTALSARQLRVLTWAVWDGYPYSEALVLAESYLRKNEEVDIYRAIWK